MIKIENFAEMRPSAPQFSSKNTNYLVAGADPVYYLEEGNQEEQVAPLIASVSWDNITPISLAGDSTQNSGVNVGFGSSLPVDYAQSFQVPVTTKLKNVKFKIKGIEGTSNYFSTSSGDVYAAIYTHSGTYGVDSKPLGSFIALSGNVNAYNITTSYQDFIFTFSGSNAITLTANTSYIVAFLSNDVGNTTNYMVLGTDTTKSASGNASYSYNGSTWTVDSTQDLYFSVLYGLTNVTLDGDVIHMVSSTVINYSIYLITSTGRVYGVTYSNGAPDGVTNLGYITGSAQSNILTFNLAIGGGDGTNINGYLFATQGGVQLVYKMPLPSGSWTATGSILSASFHDMEPFLNYIAIKDSSSTSYPSLVKKFSTTAFTVTNGVDLGSGFGVKSMKNYNDKYLAIVGGKGSVVDTGYSGNYLFLWDGISSTYNYSMKIPGKFIEMKVIDSVLYVAVATSKNKTVLYYMSGTSLKKVLTTQFSKINAYFVRSYNLCSLFNFRNYVGLFMNSTSDMNYPILVYGREDIGQFEYIHSYGKQFDQFVTGYDGNIYASQFVSVGVSNLLYLGGSAYQNIIYKSQWIPVKNLTAIDVLHDGAPTGTDSITVTIYGQGENIISGNSTTVLTPITATSYLTAKRTRLICDGFTGDQVMVKLTTSYANTRPVIRGIILI